MTQTSGSRVLAAALLVVLPTLAEAGPPLICHQFQTSDARLLPWGDGPGWNTPDEDYDIRALTRDTLALLTADAPILSRMENMRRAVIYARRDPQVAADLLTAVLVRSKGEGAPRLAVFDAGYLIESFKQARHMFSHTVTAADGYTMVQRALQMDDVVPEMEFAAAMMTAGATSAAHLRHARAATTATSLLARNMAQLGW
jgi:hypothetical protein